MARSVPFAVARASTTGTSRFTKKIVLSETKYVQFRAEIFNVFNHTNFSNPMAVTRTVLQNSGKITSAGDPRLLQFALKFFF